MSNLIKINDSVIVNINEINYVHFTGFETRFTRDIDTFTTLCGEQSDNKTHTKEFFTSIVKSGKAFDFGLDEKFAGDLQSLIDIDDLNIETMSITLKNGEKHHVFNIPLLSINDGILITLNGWTTYLSKEKIIHNNNNFTRLKDLIMENVR
ncbi:hypothetical protein [Romboutsia ilealis]|uniref:hypothetical protein n=1 Tax=Romboutsia ilealis TaxID=1115758 RepID=UPI00272A9FF7|nr:hypothetical protein [Romboutsia ilealis]